MYFQGGIKHSFLVKRTGRTGFISSEWNLLSLAFRKKGCFRTFCEICH